MNNEPNTNRQRFAYLILAASAFFLAMGHVIARGVHEQVPPLGLTFCRWLIATVFLLPLVWRDFKNALAIYRRYWQKFLLAGVLIVGGTSALTVALNFTTATNVTMINASQPAFTALLSWMLYRERLHIAQVLGIVVALAGVLMMICRGDPRVLGTLEFNGGDLIAMAAVWGLAGYAICYARISHGLSTPSALLPIILAGCLCLLPFYMWESVVYKAVPINRVSVSAILAIAFFSSFVAMIMWNRGNHLVGANLASMFINLIPIFGVLLAVTFLEEIVEGYHIVGMLMIGCGVWLVLGRGVTRKTGAA
jgi:drug/metabolite transporter (DMT)-like permease